MNRGFVTATWILAFLSVLVGIGFVTHTIILLVLVPLLGILLIPVPLVSLIFAIINFVKALRDGNNKDKRIGWIILGINVLAILLIIIGRFFIEYRGFGIPFLNGQ